MFALASQPVWIPSLLCFVTCVHLIPQITSGVTPAHLLAANMATEQFRSMHLRTSVGGLESRVLDACQLPLCHCRAGSVVVSGTITLNCVQATCNAADVQSTLSSITTINGETVDILTVSGLFLSQSIYF